MNKKNVLAVATVLCAVMLTACAALGTKAAADFGEVKSKVWQLAQVKDAKGALTFDSAKLDKALFGDIYTMQFMDGSRVTGKAAPNRYNGPYVLGEKGAFSFKNIASTMMMGIRVPEGLSEHQYFTMLSKVTGWDYKNGQLLFTARDAQDAKVTMVFKEIDYR